MSRRMQDSVASVERYSALSKPGRSNEAICVARSPALRPRVAFTTPTATLKTDRWRANSARVRAIRCRSLSSGIYSYLTYTSRGDDALGTAARGPVADASSNVLTLSGAEALTCAYR